MKWPVNECLNKLTLNSSMRQMKAISTWYINIFKSSKESRSSPQNYEFSLSIHPIQQINDLIIIQTPVISVILFCISVKF